MRGTPAGTAEGTPNTLRPPTEHALATILADAHAAREPLQIEGAGTKRAMLRPVQAARTLSTSALAGITLYAPKELIISARAGTPVAEIEAALAEHNQFLIAEPPAIPGQTIGGAVATNLSGPRRIAAGAMRDHVMGVRAVDGTGEAFHSGGRVLKNVTGLDLCKLLAGSHGTLAVMSEITLKVLPRPETQGSLLFPGQPAAAAVATLAAALGSPYGVSAAAWLPAALSPTGAAATLVRIEEFAPSVAYRLGRLRAELAPHGAADLLDAEQSAAIWQAVRDVPLPIPAGAAMWKVSVRPSAGPAVLAAAGVPGYLDWGGGLVMLAGDPAAHDRITAAATAAGGVWTVMAGPDAMRAAAAVVPPEPAPLAAITRRVKAVMDPAGILNPGRIYPGV